MTKKELDEEYPSKEFGGVNVKMRFQYPLTGKKSQWGSDERDYSETAQVTIQGWEFYLYHSCDEWVIGSLEAAQEFAENMQKAIEFVKNHPLKETNL